MRWRACGRRYRVITEAEHMLLRNVGDRVDAPAALARQALAHGAKPEHVRRDAAELAADAARNPDACMQVRGRAPAVGRPLLMWGTAQRACGPERPGERGLREVGHGGGGACAQAGGDAPAAVGFNLQLAWSSQSPVTELPPSKRGFHDVLGNAWEWGEDHYAAFPGFKVHPYYEDFSAPCFAGKHQLVSLLACGLLGSLLSSGHCCAAALAARCAAKVTLARGCVVAAAMCRSLAVHSSARASWAPSTRATSSARTFFSTPRSAWWCPRCSSTCTTSRATAQRTPS